MGRHDINVLVISPGDVRTIASSIDINEDRFDVHDCLIDFPLPGDGIVRVAKFFIEHAKSNPDEYGFTGDDAGKDANDFFERVLDIIYGDVLNPGVVIAHDRDDRFVETIADVICRAAEE